ncbi:MAG TPA: hypothetical protein VG755_44240 [Nannocystaceae bacterium]|nr:hypothetical protein [Nannocystaceae bacterium]
MKQPWLALTLVLGACHDDGEASANDETSSSSSGAEDPSNGPSSDSPSTTTTSASTTTSTTTTSTTTSADESTSTSETSTSESEGESSSEDDTGVPSDTIYEQSFAEPDGAPWPDPWQVVGDGVISSEIDGGRGRMAGTTTHTGRIILPGYAELDSEIWATIVFEDPTQQGFGFYVRQNGGALQDTDPPGLGYAVYLEGSFLRAIGIWRETNGVEEPLMETPDPVPGGLIAGVPYRVRFQCQQNGTMTAMRAKVWPVDGDEPDAWAVSVEDGTPELQDYAASFAVDVYNYAGTGSIWIDDIVITRL